MGNTISLAPKPKLLRCYNCKSKDSIFSKMDDSQIAKAVSVFSAPLDKSSVLDLNPRPFLSESASQALPEVGQVPMSKCACHEVPSGKGSSTVGVS